MKTEEVVKLAHLARLEVSDDEIESLRRDLSAILTFAERLDSEKLDNVKPLAHPLDAVQRLRPDEVTEGDQRDLFQGLAPQTRGGFYVVPKVIE